MIGRRLAVKGDGRRRAENLLYKDGVREKRGVLL
jgi:hypothetical protein